MGSSHLVNIFSVFFENPAGGILHTVFCTWPLLLTVISSVQFSCSVMSDSATPWTAAHQGSVSISNYRSLLKLMPIKPVMPSNHIILCHPLLLLPSIFPSIMVFSNESVLCIRCPEYWSFSQYHFILVYRGSDCIIFYCMDIL